MNTSNVLLKQWGTITTTCLGEAVAASHMQHHIIAYVANKISKPRPKRKYRDSAWANEVKSKAFRLRQNLMFLLTDRNTH